MRAVLFLVLLVACTQESAPEIKGVKLTFAKDTAEIARLCSDPASGALEDFGCQKNRDYGCELVILKPRGFDDHERIETLGHELWHCFTGPVHL
jgi:hypothetical protein